MQKSANGQLAKGLGSVKMPRCSNADRRVYTSSLAPKFSPSLGRKRIGLRHSERYLAGFFAGPRLLCGQLVEQHDFGLLIVRDVRVAVDSQIGPCPGCVVGEEL